MIDTCRGRNIQCIQFFLSLNSWQNDVVVTTTKAGKVHHVMCISVHGASDVYNKIRPLKPDRKLDVKINIKTASHTHTHALNAAEVRSTVARAYFLGVCVCMRVYALRRTAVTSKAAQLPRIRFSRYSACIFARGPGS